MTLIERLRYISYNASDEDTSNLGHEAAYLLESQAARIAELESYNQTRTDEMIAATRRIAELTSMVDEHGAEMWKQGEEYAILSCKQAEALARIAELEAELQIAKHNEKCTHDANVNLCKELAALRRKIDEAPVVAYVIRNAECDMKGWIPAKVWADGEFQYPLISKEDLQK